MLPASIASDVSTRIQNGVLVLSGYGIRVAVRRRHLVVEDGIGRDRRWGRFSRATAHLRRIVILGRTGTVSLESLRWLRDVGAGLIQIDRNGEVLAAFGPAGVDEPRLRRTQALAMTHPAGLEIVKWICREKVHGQESVLRAMGAKEDVQEAVRQGVDTVERAGSLDAVLIAEGVAAAAYWAAWADVPFPFARRDATRVPGHWLRFAQRGSPITGSPRLAANPANAILNYLYAILEAETRIACLAVGLDPGPGILHADQRSRASMALDIMEAVRPQVDAFVLKLLRSRVFRIADFHETSRGVCRLSPALAHTFSETAPAWAELVAPIAERVARMLLSTSGAKIRRITTPLTQRNRSAGRRGLRRKPRVVGAVRAALVPAACRICGVVLDTPNRLYCADCLPQRRREQAVGPFQQAGPATLRRLRADGRDPSHGGDATQKRGASIATRNREAAEWDRHHTERPDAEEFKRNVLPRLQGVPLQRIMKATGLSLRYCSLIRRGLYMPHPRHWEVLKSLVLSKEELYGAKTPESTGV